MSRAQRREINFGLIGCGLMGREFGSVIARWCHLLDQDVVPRLVAICDTNPGMLRWFEDNFDTLQIATTDYREVLVLRNLQGLPFEEIAQQINRSVGATRMLWLRAIDKLRSVYRKEEQSDS